MYVYVQGIFKEIFMDIVNNSPLRDTLKGILYDLTVAFKCSCSFVVSELHSETKGCCLSPAATYVQR